MRTLMILMMLVSCGDDDRPGGDARSGGGIGDSGEPLQWWTTCGDPACGGDTDNASLADCTSQTAGDGCAMEGEQCEIRFDFCNANLICATDDPTAGPGGCPISQRAAKRDIRYLGDGDLATIAARLARVKLARWIYRDDPRGEDRLGFIIEDGAPGEAVLDDRGRVDLYGYTSMAVAAFQQQQKEIEALRREVEALKRERFRPCR